ncbi:MAG: ferredoxin [Hyphomicrobiaceae bacterium]|jgi:ferredoxin
MKICQGHNETICSRFFGRFRINVIVPTNAAHPAPNTFRVEFANLDGAVVHVRPGRSILDATQDAGLRLPYACGIGECTSCAGRVIQGQVSQSDRSGLSPNQRNRGFVLLCIATPLSDCILVAGSTAQTDL